MSEVGFRHPKTKKLMPLYDIRPSYAIMDTGVSYSIIPTRDFDKIKSELENSYNVTFGNSNGSDNVSTFNCQCANYNDLPDLQIALDRGRLKSSTQMAAQRSLNFLQLEETEGDIKMEPATDFDEGHEPVELKSRASKDSKLFTITKE